LLAGLANPGVTKEFEMKKLILCMAFFATTGCETDELDWDEFGPYEELGEEGEQYRDASLPAASATVTVRKSSHNTTTQQSIIQFKLPNGQNRQWTLVDECHEDVMHTIGPEAERNSLLDCDVTCNDFNSVGECIDCDINCTTG